MCQEVKSIRLDFSVLCDCSIYQDFEFLICFNCFPHSTYLLLNLICILNATFLKSVKASDPTKPESSDANQSQVNNLSN